MENPAVHLDGSLLCRGCCDCFPVFFRGAHRTDRRLAFRLPTSQCLPRGFGVGTLVFPAVFHHQNRAHSTLRGRRKGKEGRFHRVCFTVLISSAWRNGVIFLRFFCTFSFRNTLFLSAGFSTRMPHGKTHRGRPDDTPATKGALRGAGFFR